MLAMPETSLSLSRAKNAGSYLSLMLWASACCSYIGQRVDLFLDERWKLREV